MLVEMNILDDIGLSKLSRNFHSGSELLILKTLKVHNLGTMF